MTGLLQKAFERAATLPQDEQDRLACILLAEMESEQKWAEILDRPELEDLLERLADEAMAAHRTGQTEPLKFDDMYDVFADGEPSLSESDELEEAR